MRTVISPACASSSKAFTVLDPGNSTASCESVIPTGLAISCLVEQDAFFVLLHGEVREDRHHHVGRRLPQGARRRTVGRIGGPTEPGTRSMTPPIGSAVVLSMPARVSAAWFTQRLWCPSDQSAIGLVVSPTRSDRQRTDARVQGLTPAAPLVGLEVGVRGDERTEHVFVRRRAARRVQVRRVEEADRGRRVGVPVREARHEHLALEVDDLGLLADERAGAAVGAHVHDLVAPHRDRLRGALARVHGVDVPVREHGVGRTRLLGAGDAGERKQRHDGDHEQPGRENATSLHVTSPGERNSPSRAVTVGCTKSLWYTLADVKAGPPQSTHPPEPREHRARRPGDRRPRRAGGAQPAQRGGSARRRDDDALRAHAGPADPRARRRGTAPRRGRHGGGPGRSVGRQPSPRGALPA